MKRLIDKQTVAWVRDKRDGTCIYGFAYAKSRDCNGGLEVHHIIKRSQLGDDVENNLITLCHHHHEMAERREIKSDEFVRALRKLGKYKKG